MKSVIARSALCLVLMAFALPHNPEDRMSAFKWMIGTWVMKSADGKIMETWLPMNDSVYAGESTLYKKTTETVPLERMQLVCRNKTFYFIPSVSGQNNGQPVEFRVTSISKSGFVAENPQHDFPKKISYRLVKKDSLYAFIEGGGRKTNYYYARVKKEAPSKTLKK